MAWAQRIGGEKLFIDKSHRSGYVNSIMWGQVIGSAIGSYFGSKGSGGDGIDVSENYRLGLAQSDVALRHEGLRYAATSAGAKAGGYHPLYALGQQPFQPSVIAGQPGGGSNHAELGAAIGGGIDHYLGRGARAKKAANAQQAHDAAIKESNYRAEESRSRAQYNDVMRAKTLSDMTRLAQTQTNDVGRRPQDTLMHKYITVWNPITNRTETMPNPKLGAEYPETYGAGLLLRAGQHDVSPSRPGTYGPTDVAP